MNNSIYRDSNGFFKCSLLIKLIKTNIKREFNKDEILSIDQILNLNNKNIVNVDK